MPLVRISLRSGKPEWLNGTAIGDAVYRAMVKS